MALKLSAFITVTHPIKRGDTYKECRAMAQDLCDEVVIIDGHKTWPNEFTWPIIGEHFQRGYEQATGDWVVHLDTDFIFHQDDFAKIRHVIEKYNDEPGLSFLKYQFIQPHKYNLKSRLILAVNKGVYGDRIRFDSGGDLCQPSLDGEYIKPGQVPETGIPFYNYEKPTKTKEQIMDDVGRMDRAYHKHFGKYLYSTDGTDKSAYDGWYNMMKGRYMKPQKELLIEDQPKYMHDTLCNLKPEQFGWNGFGLRDA